MGRVAEGGAVSIANRLAGLETSSSRSRLWQLAADRFRLEHDRLPDPADAADVREAIRCFREIVAAYVWAEVHGHGQQLDPLRPLEEGVRFFEDLHDRPPDAGSAEDVGETVTLLLFLHEFDRFMLAEVDAGRVEFAGLDAHGRTVFRPVEAP